MSARNGAWVALDGGHCEGGCQFYLFDDGSVGALCSNEKFVQLDGRPSGKYGHCPECAFSAGHAARCSRGEWDAEPPEQIGPWTR